MIRRLFALPLLALSLLAPALPVFAAPPGAASSGKDLDLKELIVALKADKNPDRMIEERGRLEKELTKLLRVPVKVIIPTSSAVILQGFANGTVDIGYLSSLDMVNAERAGAAELLLAGKIKGKTSYESLWLIKKDASYKNLEDLKGKSIAFASRTSTSGYLIPYWELIMTRRLEAKHDPTEFFGEGNVWYGTGYVSAVQRVLDGTSEAAAVSDYVFHGDKHLSPEQKSRLKILKSQGPVPTHVIAARRTLTDSQKKKVRDALVALNSNPTLRDQVFTSELVVVDSARHLATTKQALELTGLVIETK